MRTTVDTARAFGSKRRDTRGFPRWSQLVYLPLTRAEFDRALPPRVDSCRTRRVIFYLFNGLSCRAVYTGTCIVSVFRIRTRTADTLLHCLLPAAQHNGSPRPAAHELDTIT